ncbi:MAG: zinc dependent phospholipase C family protein [Nitrospirae bacterium]|nr:zinc dependent phospholipase C family protein [Nitrospirota bacterium]
MRWYALIGLIFLILFVPKDALAWGPLTHLYLGNEIFNYAALIPPNLFEILSRYKDDFLYGNLMADIIFGKKYIMEYKNPHSWDVAFELMDSVSTDSEKAFVYGYMSHLAADTVAHEQFSKTYLKAHTILELNSDSIVGRKYWLMAISLNRRLKNKHDHLLQSTLESPFFSFKTNKKIFKGMIFLSLFTPNRMNRIIDKSLIFSPYLHSRQIKKLHRKSLDRIVDLLCKGECSRVLGKSAIYNPRTR